MKSGKNTENSKCSEIWQNMWNKRKMLKKNGNLIELSTRNKIEMTKKGIGTDGEEGGETIEPQRQNTAWGAGKKNEITGNEN